MKLQAIALNRGLLRSALCAGAFAATLAAAAAAAAQAPPTPSAGPSANSGGKPQPPALLPLIDRLSLQTEAGRRMVAHRAPNVQHRLARLAARVAEVTALGQDPAQLTLRNSWRVDRTGAIQVYIRLAPANDAALAALQASGVNPTRVDLRYSGVAQAWLKPFEIERTAALPMVAAVTLPDYARTRTGNTLTEGDAAMQANDLREPPYCLDGDGVRVGIISDGVDNAHEAVATGDLPLIPGTLFDPDVMVHPGSEGEGDEGTAMLEIVHDIAPNAELAFSGPETSVDMVASIQWLADTAHCDVICDDLGFYDEPFFEDGAVALAAADAVSTGGVVYVSSAGNEAKSHHQHAFRGVVVNNAATNNENWTLYDWDGAGDYSMTVTIAAKGDLQIVLQWDDQMHFSSNNLDLYVTDAAETAVVGSSTDDQSGKQDPVEAIGLTNPNNAPFVLHVFIRATNLPDFAGNPELELFVTDGTMNDQMTAEDSIFGHPARLEVISVAAVDAADTPCGLEDFSSHGPSTIRHPFSESRATPTISAPDGVSVSGAGCFACPDPCPPVGACKFFGTSAAAPHIAGVAAQLLELAPGSAPSTIREALTDGATPCGAPVPNRQFGAGCADAFHAGLALDEERFACPCDLNNDDQVDGADLGMLLRSWGDPGCGGAPRCRPDLNCDGQVDAADLGMLLAAWGPC